MSEKRLFSDAEKIAVELVQEKCGDADHIIPWSQGGKTSVENCQILGSTTNKKKNDFNFNPRKWQLELFRTWDEREPHRPFMLIAIPGD